MGEEEEVNSEEEGGEELGAGCSGFSHSLLDDEKAVKEEEIGGSIRD